MRLYHPIVLAAALLGGVLCHGAIAQPASVASIVTTCGTPNVTYAAGDTKPITMDTTGALCSGGAGGGSTGGAGTPTEAAVSCAATTTTLLAAAAAAKFVTVQVPSTATATVWVNVAGASAVAAAPSLSLPPGASTTWTLAGYLPTSQWNCISTTGTVPVTITYK